MHNHEKEIVEASGTNKKNKKCMQNEKRKQAPKRHIDNKNKESRKLTFMELALLISKLVVCKNRWHNLIMAINIQRDTT